MRNQRAQISGDFLVADPLARLPELIEQGKRFAWENFAWHDSDGNPSVYSDDWLVWTHHANEVAAAISPSNISETITGGLRTPVLNFTEEQFEIARAMILNGLSAALSVYGPGADVPASDRVVTLGHNSAEQVEALEKIDELIDAVETANDFPGSIEDKELTIVELSAARKLFEFAKVRVAAATEILQPRLRWLIDKAGGALIGILAKGLWDYLVGLHIL